MDLFRKVWSIYTIMKEEAIEGNRADFTGLVCQQIVWVVTTTYGLFSTNAYTLTNLSYSWTKFLSQNCC
jgi:hypothetical protein